VIVKLGICQNLVKSKSLLLTIVIIWENQQSEIYIYGDPTLFNQNLTRKRNSSPKKLSLNIGKNRKWLDETALERSSASEVDRTGCEFELPTDSGIIEIKENVRHTVCEVMRIVAK
jgi:hypothetical protein